MHDEQKSGLGVTLSPKSSFILGLVGGVLVLCTIGFFILLSVMVKGGSLSMGSGSGNPSAVVPSAVPSVADDGTTVVGEVAPLSDDDHIRGDKNADIILYEYSDFECPFCSRFHPSMEQLMADPAYKGKVAWVYRHFPLSFHPNATPAANASECAAEQGKFWEFADALFADQGSIGDAFYGTLADRIGLNRSKFDDCYAAKKYNAKVLADQTSGATAGVNGTPGTIIVNKNGDKQLVPGAVPYEQLKAMVDASLAL